jgi:ubiquinone/menaquinone biosynthesis C-methylase UbiE
MIRSYLDLAAERNILEVGCGEGRISALLASEASSYIAVDTDPKRLEQAMSDYPEVDFRSGNGENLDFADKQFDAVIFTLSLHHQDCKQALLEAFRVLKDDGRVVIIEPAIDGEFQQFFNLFHDETVQLQNSIAEIKRSNFSLIKNDIFSIIVEFSDLEEMVAYPFDRQMVKAEDRLLIEEKIRQISGSVENMRAIRLDNKLNIFLLEKPCQ